MTVEIPEEKLLMQKIARLFDEARGSRASHIRKLKDLSALRSSIPTARFFPAFSKTLNPIFTTQRRIASVERIVQFVASFACIRDPNTSDDCDSFFELFLRFLITGTTASNRTARFRACQIISEIIMRLPDDAEVSSELWDEVIDCIKDVRKTILLSYHPLMQLPLPIINCTLDVSESVQDNYTPERTSDRSEAVTKECLKLLKDEWLMKSCNGDPIELLRYLDVETYESIGVSVMEALLKAGLVNCMVVKVLGNSYHQTTIQLEDFMQVFTDGAQAKGSDAAMTSGTEAAVYASEASDSNDLLEKILPESVSEYIDLVKAHIVAGQSARFTARQLLLLGSMLDFSDASNRKVAAVFVIELLNSPLQHEVDDDGNKVIIGDGISLGGERDWADAVSALAKKVYATQGEFEQVILSVVADLAQPCRERTADFLEWMHCLSVIGLLLEHIKSLRWMHGNAMEPTELLQCLLLQGQTHPSGCSKSCCTMFRSFWNVGKSLTEDLVKQLRLSFVKGPSLVSSMACKALIDLVMWHGPEEVDKAMNRNLLSQFEDHARIIHPVNWSDTDEDLDIKLIDLLYAGFDRRDFSQSVDADENESVHAVLAEGFAKILLLSDNYPTICVSSYPILLTKIINLYFSNRASELQRLKQCLSVFFEHYPSLSANHKASSKCICKAFIPVMRSMWPGINGTAGGSNVVVSNMRKRAIQASRFMLQMLQAPLYPKETDQVDNNLPDQNGSDCVEEGLAIYIEFPEEEKCCREILYFSYSKILVLLSFKQTELVAVKLMRRLMNRVAEGVSADKDVLKEVKQMSERLKAFDTSPDEPLQPEQANLILEKLDIQLNIDDDDAESSFEVEPTPLPRSTRPALGRRRARQEKESSSSDDDDEDETAYNSVVPANPVTVSVRSQRASKSAALSKLLSITKPDKIVDDEDEEDEGDGDESAVTSEDDSD
ncbi:hypothetical protein E3N88_01635 [Mikania micrantha]|uniref:Nuclear condensin complex subunit 3 C-terminal domain-containing protein n=1 Tax=Mikania micrantha TaxID=192012 RepID=A0A5N6Q1M7_9ASTR|nr:hypothetical protein E3N88_01635 [Mikania micrantha]